MDFDNLEAIIAFAIEKEKEAAEFYEENSESEMMSGKRQMLKEFAAEERKHQKMLESYLAIGIAENIEGYRFQWISDICSAAIMWMQWNTSRAWHTMNCLCWP